MQTHVSTPNEQIQAQQGSRSIQLRLDNANKVSDHRSMQSAQRRVQNLANASKTSTQLKTLQTKMQGGADVTQRVEEGEPFQGRIVTAQCVEEELPLQGKFETAQREEKAKPNNTGLPDQLKSGIESMSGMSMDHVRVHYNSDKPAQLNAHAYAQGSEIHVAPGQEQHLPHEAWHVVQQAQGRVKPTMQMKQGVPVNDDVGLEVEADVMGARAMQSGQVRDSGMGASASSPSKITDLTNSSSAIAQRTSWAWVNGAWAAQDEEEPHTPQPERDGAYFWEIVDTALVEEEDEPEPIVYTMTYGAAHGDLHFGGAPTVNKSKWSISKDAAKALMETEMRSRMQDIVAAATAADNGQIAWILVADSDVSIGRAVGHPSVTRFQIQLQADSESGDISYHGFPDEQALHTGLGPSRNRLT